MSLMPLKRDFIEAAISARMSAILVELPKYRCLVGIPAGKENKSTRDDFLSIPATYKKAQKNIKKLGLAAPGLSIKVFFELLRRAQTPNTDIATYAAKQEFGSVSENIPKRPFLRTTFEGARLIKIRKKATILLSECAKQNRNAKDFLEKIGIYAAGEVRKNIKFGRWGENSPVTKAIKGSTKPLIDTSTMIRAITAWVDTNVREKTLLAKKVS